ncbi:MAG: CerR family C-terminal domain-containing protein [Burkholderiales bacterium]
MASSIAAPKSASPISPATPTTRRADGVEARACLLRTALRLFAKSGYRGASTRAICQAAGVNLASIRYYFGDKLGLYRAAVREPMIGPIDTAPGDRKPRGCFEPGAKLSRESLETFFRRFLAPLKAGEDSRQMMKLHFREMIEPTGAWDEAINQEIKPEHAQLVKMIVADLGLERADLDVQRLSFCIIGVAVHFFVGQNIIDQIAPGVLATPRAIDTLAERLAVYAMGMIEAERTRRRKMARTSK